MTWFPFWLDSLTSALRRHGARPRPPRRTATRLNLELLEDRWVPALYAVTDLGTLGGDFSVGFGINNAGRVVGISDTAAVDPVNGSLSDAFEWADGRLTDLGTLGGQFSGARAINDRGQAVGYAQNADPDPVNGAIHAALWDRGALHDLGTLPGTLFSDAWGVNDRGQVTGWAFTDDPETNPVTSPPNSHAFFWEGGVLTDLPLPAGFKNAFGGAINDRGQVAGYAADDASAHPLVWQRQAGRFQVTDVGIPAGYLGGALRAINNGGEVAGLARWADASVHAFVWRPDAHGGYQPTDLGGLGGPDAEPRDINDRGQVVGLALTPGGEAHAFLHDAAGMHDLNDLIPAGSGWLLDTARGINDRGEVVGVGVHDGQLHAFLLEPAVERAADGGAARFAGAPPAPAGGPSDGLPKAAQEFGRRAASPRPGGTSLVSAEIRAGLFAGELASSWTGERGALHSRRRAAFVG
jgi:probable HAF family extracellular repeat protein